MPTLKYDPFPSVAPTETAPGGFQQLRVTPQMFGAAQGEALSGLAQKFEQAGDALANVTIQRQNLHNQVATDEASVGTRDDLEKLLYGDPNTLGDTGFFGKKGRAAMDAYPGVRKTFDELIQKRKSVLQNPVQQHLFERDMRNARSILINSMGRHYDQESNRHNVSVYEGQAKQAQQGVARAAALGDDTLFNEES